MALETYVIEAHNRATDTYKVRQVTGEQEGEFFLVHGSSVRVPLDVEKLQARSLIGTHVTMRIVRSNWYDAHIVHYAKAPKES